MKSWALSHHKDEPYSVVVWDQPKWTVMVETVVESVDTVFRHKWCSPPEFFFKVPLGKPVRDVDGFIENSLGGAICGSFQRLVAVGYHRESVRVYVPVSKEVAEKIDAKAVAEFVDMFDLDTPETDDKKG